MNAQVSDARILELIGRCAAGSMSDDDCVDAGCALKQLLEYRNNLEGKLAGMMVKLVLAGIRE